MLNHKRYFGYALSLAAAISLASCDDDSGQRTKPKADDEPQVECYNTDDCNELYPGGVKLVAMRANA